MESIIENLKQVISQVEQEQVENPSGGISTALDFLVNALEYLEEEKK